jgi:hypothetical protein
MHWTARSAIACMLVAGATDFQPAAAQDCPDSRSVSAGYVVERGSRSQTQVYQDGRIVRTVMRFSGTTMLETTQFEGLFELDRVDRGRRTTSKPTSDLARLFPLKSGQQSVAGFEVTNASAASIKRTITLHVVGTDELYIGKCKYRIFKIERSQSQDNAPAVFLNVDYYAPELKLVIAKEFRERGGQTSLNKFDKIYPMPAGK